MWGPLSVNVLLHVNRPEKIREKYKCCTSHFKGWQVFVETLFDHAAYTVHAIEEGRGQGINFCQLKFTPSFFSHIFSSSTLFPLRLCMVCGGEGGCVGLCWRLHTAEAEFMNIQYRWDFWGGPGLLNSVWDQIQILQKCLTATSQKVQRGRGLIQVNSCRKVLFCIVFYESYPSMVCTRPNKFLSSPFHAVTVSWLLTAPFLWFWHLSLTTSICIGLIAYSSFILMEKAQESPTWVLGQDYNPWPILWNADAQNNLATLHTYYLLCLFSLCSEISLPCWCRCTVVFKVTVSKWVNSRTLFCVLSDNNDSIFWIKIAI